jgi:hypothetical protein
MANTTKQGTRLDADQAIQGAYNDVNSTLGVDGFLTGKVGRRVDLAITDTDLGAGETQNTEIYTFSESGTTLYQLTIVYTNSDRSQMVSAERTA